MVSWEVVYAEQALKDAKKLVASGLKTKAQELLTVRVLRMWMHYAQEAQPIIAQDTAR